MHHKGCKAEYTKNNYDSRQYSGRAASNASRRCSCSSTSDKI